MITVQGGEEILIHWITESRWYPLIPGWVIFTASTPSIKVQWQINYGYLISINWSKLPCQL